MSWHVNLAMYHKPVAYPDFLESLGGLKSGTSRDLIVLLGDLTAYLESSVTWMGGRVEGCTSQEYMEDTTGLEFW